MYIRSHSSGPLATSRPQASLTVSTRLSQASIALSAESHMRTPSSLTMPVTGTRTPSISMTHNPLRAELLLYGRSHASFTTTVPTAPPVVQAPMTHSRPQSLLLSLVSMLAQPLRGVPPAKQDRIATPLFHRSVSIPEFHKTTVPL